MPRFIVTIDTENAAFGDSEWERLAEVHRILTHQVTAGVIRGVTEGVLLDSNGNTVGRFALEEPDADAIAALTHLRDRIAVLDHLTQTDNTDTLDALGEALTALGDRDHG